MWAAALFAVHPLCGATVAWIAEQKNLLCVFLALIAYHQHLRARENGSSRAAAAAALLFVLAMLAKPVVAGLVVLVWATDIWRQGWRRAPWIPLAPWLAATLVLGLITVHFQLEVLPVAAGNESLGLRIVRAPWI